MRRMDRGHSTHDTATHTFRLLESDCRPIARPQLYGCARPAGVCSALYLELFYVVLATCALLPFFNAHTPWSNHRTNRNAHDCGDIIRNGSGNNMRHPDVHERHDLVAVRSCACREHVANASQLDGALTSSGRRVKLPLDGCSPGEAWQCMR